MIVESKDYHQILTLFDKYMNDKKTRTVTHVGFYKFMLTTLQIPAWIVKDLKRQIKQDPRLKFHLDTIIEDFLLTGALTGTLKEGAVKLVLKNKFGYEENPAPSDDHSANVTRQVTYRAATKEDAVKLIESKES